MKILLLAIAIAFSQLTYSQISIEFAELDYGLAQVGDRRPMKADNVPTGERNVSTTLDFVEHTDSIQIAPKASFGIMYMLKAIDSVDINVDVEWIFPKKMVDDKGNKYKSIRYTSKKPTNTELGNTYTFDEQYEMIEGKWILNIYYENKKLFSRTFIVYK